MAQLDNLAAVFWALCCDLMRRTLAGRSASPARQLKFLNAAMNNKLRCSCPGQHRLTSLYRLSLKNASCTPARLSIGDIW
jgi:hypothetical protein